MLGVRSNPGHAMFLQNKHHEKVIISLVRSIIINGL